ncbi:MAG: mechanosensitive ion channel family protein [Gammaproteobacteria bacterium]|nr:MAG: mechanosensitive ion channel family protein [Gammaproteobacteria bacterium]
MLEFLTAYLGENAWVGQVFTVVLATAIVHWLARQFMARLGRQLEKTQNLYDDAVLEAARKPLAWAIWLVGISWAAESTGGEAAQAEVFEHVGAIREVGIIALLAWFTVRFIGFVETHISDASYRENPADPTTASAVGKLLRATVIITAILMVMQTLGFSISGVLAFGGVGGIAVGFAARDLLANFFGAIMIYLDRPFSVGDWIRSPDKSIEGTVEEIGWRLTRIRTFDARPLYVPNGTFTSISVENPSRMTNRRIKETIGVRYSDVGVLQDIIRDVKDMLRNHEAIDQRKTLMVNFNEFGPSSLDFFIYTFTRTTVWGEYHEIKQDVLLKIAAIIESHGAEIAFPTRTVVLEPEPDAAPAPAAS